MFKIIYFVVIENTIARLQLNVCEIYDVIKIQKRVKSCQKYVFQIQNFVLQFIVTMWKMNDRVICWMKNKNWNKWKKNCENDDYWNKRTCEKKNFRFRNINSRHDDHETTIEMKWSFLNWFFEFFFSFKIDVVSMQKKNIILRIHTLWRLI